MSAHRDLYLFIHCDGWVRFGPYESLEYDADGAVVKDQAGRVVASLHPGAHHWTIPGGKVGRFRLQRLDRHELGNPSAVEPPSERAPLRERSRKVSRCACGNPQGATVQGRGFHRETGDRGGGLVVHGSRWPCGRRARACLTDRRRGWRIEAWHGLAVGVTPSATSAVRTQVRQRASNAGQSGCSTARCKATKPVGSQL